MVYIEHLKGEVDDHKEIERVLRQQNADLRNHLRKSLQVAQALGDVNRYYASLGKPRAVDENGALEHYFRNDGPGNFAAILKFNKALRRHMRRIHSESQQQIAV